MKETGASLAFRRMRPRAPDEAHRSVTPLELLFDLTFVAAVAQLTGPVAHAVAAGEIGEAAAPFLMVFFAIWWAWMNFTWFASAYDTDDALYRLATFVQMGGVVVLAAGIGPAFEHGDFMAVFYGYLIMRVGLLSLWVRAAVAHPEGRSTALRYVVGFLLLQLLWFARLSLDGQAAVLGYAVLVVLELCVPAWAQRLRPTTWHPHHIAERYALFTIILLGEGVLAATSAVVAVVEEGAGPDLVGVSAAGLAVVGALWWLYFAESAGPGLEANRRWSYAWGYGHFILFAAMAGLGAGLEVVVAMSAGEAEGLDASLAVAAIALPVAVIIVMLDLLRVPAEGEWPRVSATTGGGLAALCLVTVVASWIGPTSGVYLVAATTALFVGANVVHLRAQAAPSAPDPA